MKNSWARVLWIVIGILLAAAGIFCMVRPGAALGSLAVLLGLAMLLSGVADIVIFAATHAFLMGAGWILADGLLTVILSLFVLFNSAFTAAAIPLIFGMWLLFTGIARIISSFDLKKLGVTGWGWFLAVGILLAAGGFLSFLNPVVAAVAIGILVGISLILEGVSSIVHGVFYSRLLP